MKDKKQKAAEYMRNYYAKIRKAGKCTGCYNKSALPGKRKCQDCYDKWNSQRATRRKERKSRGICTECSLPPIPGEIRCEFHKKENADSVIKRRNSFTAAGLCQRCGKSPHVQGNQSCTTCVLKAFAHDLWRDRSRWSELLDLFNKQGGRCRYTNQPLVIGQGASIDHIVATSKGGTDDISNLQWVKLVVNKMKTDQPEPDFLMTCVAVGLPITIELVNNSHSHRDYNTALRLSR